MPKKQGHTWNAKLLAFIISPFNVMVKQCPWCWKITGFKRGNRGCTGAMCKECSDREFTKLNETIGMRHQD